MRFTVSIIVIYRFFVNEKCSVPAAGNSMPAVGRLQWKSSVPLSYAKLAGYDKMHAFTKHKNIREMPDVLAKESESRILCQIECCFRRQPGRIWMRGAGTLRTLFLSAGMRMSTIPPLAVPF